MEPNKISIIVPVYRVENYLIRCINSILNQTYKNLEIILVDDGSDDRCPEICDEFAIKDNRVKVIHKKNGGVAAARNSGLSAVTGEIIAFVDPDDYIKSNMYEALMKNFINENADIAMCDFKYVYKDTKENDIQCLNNNHEIEFFDGVSAQYKSYENNYNGILFSVSWNKIFKRELFEGITYPSDRIYEDEARTCQVLYKAKKIIYIKEVFYFYYQHKESIVGKTISEKNLQLIDAYTDKLKFYRDKTEYELWQVEASHAMHMTCYMQKRFDDTCISLRISDSSQGKRLVNELKMIKEIKEIKKKLLLEIGLFVVFPSLYYLMWKTRSGK